MLDRNFAPPGTVAKLWDFKNQHLEATGCHGCYFKNPFFGCQRPTKHSCVASRRPDKCWVIYVKKP